MHLNFLKRFYSDFNNKKILELGCGKGDFLLECYKEGLNIVGIDINPKYIKISKEKIKNNRFKSSIIQSRGEELPFKNNYFDFINCVEVLEHTRDPKRVLMECRRTLKNNGQIFITIHNRFGAKDAHYKLWFLNWMPRFLGKIYIKIRKRNKNINKFLDIQEIDKMHYYTYYNFKKLSKSIGFKLKDTRKIQISRPELIINKKLRKILLFFKKNRINFLIKFFYSILNIFYFNTFHLILVKK